MTNGGDDSAAALPLVVAAAALIDGHGRLLVQRRPVGKPDAGWWEFPGGKVERGETPEAALSRELREELGIAVESRDLAPLSFTTGAADVGMLVLLLYACRRWRGDVRALHAERIAWQYPSDLAALALIAADRRMLDRLRTETEVPDLFR